MTTKCVLCSAKQIVIPWLTSEPANEFKEYHPRCVYQIYNSVWRLALRYDIYI